NSPLTFTILTSVSFTRARSLGDQWSWICASFAAMLPRVIVPSRWCSGSTKPTRPRVDAFRTPRAGAAVPAPRVRARSWALRRPPGTRVAPLERPCRVRRRATASPALAGSVCAVRAGGVSTRVGGGLRDVVPRRAVLDAPALGLELDRSGSRLDRAARLRLRDARPLPHGRAAGRVPVVAALPGRGTRVRAADGRG